jgi:hypothetical protein
MIRVPTKANERSTANPSNLKGSNNSQIKGYRIIKRMAKGQHKTNRIHQSRKLAIRNFI